MSQVDLLARLQEIDLEIQTDKSELVDVLGRIKDHSELESAQAAHTAAAAAKQSSETKLQDLNLQVGALDARIKSADNRLYSGKVTSPKELTDLQNGLAALRRQKVGVEDQVLEVMLELEENNATHETTTADLDLTQTIHDQSQVELEARKNELALKLNQLIQSRKERAGMVDSALLKRYQSIREKRRGVAIAKVRGNSCKGCQTGLPANTLKQVSQGEIVQCPHCDRILDAS